MTKLHEYDILFLLAKTKLSAKSLIKIIEEERDFNLVIQSIAEKMTDEDFEILPKLSEKLQVKLVIYYCSRHKEYDIDEKSYITDIIIPNYNFIYKNGYILKNSKNKLINDLLSVAKKEKSDISKINEISNKFSKSGMMNIGLHLCDWLFIINNSKKIILSVTNCTKINCNNII